MERFRGGFPATIDAKGRFKLPAKLREQLEMGFGRDVYVCSFFPHELRVYPLAVWQGVEERLLNKPAMKPSGLSRGLLGWDGSTLRSLNRAYGRLWGRGAVANASRSDRHAISATSGSKSRA